MKVVIFLFSLLCSQVVVAQMVFAPVGAVWHLEYIKDLDIPGLNYTRHEVTKDTVYEGKLCSKIIGKTISINAAENGYDTVELPTQYTYVSDDTIFYYNLNFSHFYPLYIFNVKVGDTVTYHVPYLRPPFTDTTFKAIVSSIDEVVIGGQKLKKIRHADYYSSIFRLGAIIERLGAEMPKSVIGYLPFPTHPYFAAIRCYRDKDIDVNIGLWGFRCDEFAPLRVQEDIWMSGLKVFPNPGQYEISIEYPVGQGPLKFRIWDIIGRAQVVSQQFSGNKVTFDIRNLPPGLYFLQIQDPNGKINVIKFNKI